MNSAQLYSKFNALTQHVNKTVINKKLNVLKFKRQENIFEVGCGTGASTKNLLKHIAHDYNKYVATDVLQTMVDQAVVENTNNVQFDQFDITTKETIKQEWSQEFDKLFSFSALNSILGVRRQQYYKNINRLLKVNGSAFHVIVSDSLDHETYKDLYHNPKWRPYYNHQYDFVPFCNKLYINRTSALEDILKRTKHEILDLEYMDIDYTFESTDEFKNSAKAVNPFVSKIPVHLHEDYWNDLWQSYEKFSDVMTTGQLKTGVLFIATRKVNDI